MYGIITALLLLRLRPLLDKALEGEMCSDVNGSGFEQGVYPQRLRSEGNVCV